MPRPLRIEYPGARYHVMNRGDRREDIFCDSVDREMFLGLLGRACAKTGWEGTKTPADVAEKEMKDTLNPWVVDSMARSHFDHDGLGKEHNY